MQQLHQQRNRDHRTFKLTQDALLIERKKLGRYDRYQLEWEEIDFDAVVQGRAFEPRQLKLVGSILLNAILIFAVLYLIWPSLGGRWWFYGLMALVGFGFVPSIIDLCKVNHSLILYGESNVYFSYRPEEQQEVDAFILEMKRMRADYLRRRYLQIDELLPLEGQLEVVRELYLKKIISRQDLEGVMEEVKVRRLFDS